MPKTQTNIGKLYGGRRGLIGPRVPVPVGEFQGGDLVAPNMLGGMVTGIPRDQLQPNTGSSVVNARVRDEWLGIRPGTDEYAGAAIDVNPVLAIVTFITESRDIYTCRLTYDSFHVVDAAATSWTAYTFLDEDGNELGNYASATGGDADTEKRFRQDVRFSFAQFFSKLYIADGVNAIWEVDFGHHTVTQIVDAPRARFLMTFADRIVAGDIDFYKGGPRPNTIQWCVNADPGDWTGYSSGWEDLAATEIGDTISGLVSLESGSVIVRKNSIWSLTRQAFQTPVFSFRPVVQGLGCDLPYTIARIPGGMIFADQRTRGIYVYSPQSGPQPIRLPDPTMFDSMDLLEYAQGAYDPYEREYHLGLIESGETQITKTWVYSFQHQAWTYDDSPEVSCIGVVSLPDASVAIDDLVSTITSQSGTIDEFGGGSEFVPTLLKGVATGEVIKQSYDYATDYDDSVFTFSFISQNFGSQSLRREMKNLAVRSLVATTGDVLLDERNEDGSWRHEKTDTITGSAVPTNVRIPNKRVSGEDLYFRIRSSAAAVKFYSWVVQVHEKGRQV